MKLLTLLASAVLTILLPAPCAAGEQLYWERGGRTIQANPGASKSCTLTESYEDGSVIVLVYSPSLPSLQLGFTEKNATSVAPGQEVSLKLKFAIKNEWDDGWGNKTATANVLPTGVRLFTLLLDAKDFLRDFSEATTIAIYTEDDALISAFNLNGSMIAVQKLRACAFQQAGLNPNDPFLK